jgi:hypothetical protein
MPWSSVWCVPFRLYNQSFVRISYLPHVHYMARLSHPPRFQPLAWIVTL